MLSGKDTRSLPAPGTPGMALALPPQPAAYQLLRRGAGLAAGGGRGPGGEGKKEGKDRGKGGINKDGGKGGSCARPKR